MSKYTFRACFRGLQKTANDQIVIRLLMRRNRVLSLLLAIVFDKVMIPTSIIFKSHYSFFVLWILLEFYSPSYVTIFIISFDSHNFNEPQTVPKMRTSFMEAMSFCWASFLILRLKLVLLRMSKLASCC